MNKILVVTKNKYKQWEFRNRFHQLLPKLSFSFKTYNFEEFCHFSLAENAKSKATQAFQKFKQPILIDDTIFLLKKYKNFPGLHNKWLMDSIGINGFLQLINNGDKASFYCALAFYDGRIFRIFSGSLNGQIKTGRGQVEEGLDYSSFFLPNREKRLMADFYKSHVPFTSHRTKAIIKLTKFLNSYYENH